MTAWVALFATQVWLISSRQVRVHQRLGYAGVGLGAFIVITGLVTAMRAGKADRRPCPPTSPGSVHGDPAFDLLMFSILFGAAVYYRKRPAAHKSLMLLTAINFVPPAIARIPIAPLQNLGPLWFFGFPTVLILVCLAIDWRRRGQLNLVFLAGSLLLVASYPVRLVLMGTAAWMQFALWLTSRSSERRQSPADLRDARRPTRARSRIRPRSRSRPRSARSGCSRISRHSPAASRSVSSKRCPRG